MTANKIEIEHKKLIWSNQKSSLNQIYSKGMECALCSPKDEQCHPFVMCKDWLQDAIWAFLHKKQASIYGFSYSPDKNPALDLDTIRLVVVNSQDKALLNKIENTISFINQFEKHFKLKRTKAYIIDNPPKKYEACGAVQFVSSGRWAMSPPMISLYSLLIRAGFMVPKGTNFIEALDKIQSGDIPSYQIHDKSYLTQSRKVIDNMLKLGYRVFFKGEVKENYPENVNISSLHNNSGIVSLANGSSRTVCKHWTRKQIAERLNGTYVPKQKDPVSIEEDIKEEITSLES